MAEPDLKRVKEVYTGALEQPSERRQAYLEEACRGDQQLRNKVERMLAAIDGAADFMTGEGKIAAAETLDVSSTAQVHPESIGHYKIIHPIGEGGMGIVYLAEQTEPVRRRVALKLVKLGMDTKQVVARFEAERQALAMMDHPNVAQVFEAGATETGRPYFAMEYVPGVPITKFCDTLCLTMPERLELFIQVCGAIQHAHQKGIIHRDLKPTNVLVMRQDGKPVPKVIDFGVAKATQQRLTEQTLFTEQGQMIGTPAYMSPEQAEMSASGVDSRTDVYSLGVLLYELLVSMLPFEPAELRRAGYAEIQRIIREVDPPKPSTRFNSLADESGNICDQRRLDTKSMRRLLKGDLDWITMRAMDKDPARRYASASELAADIGRYLKHEPVAASPPGRAYRFRKFVRRNRTGVIAAGTVLVILLAGIAGTTTGMVRAGRAEATAANEAEKAKRDRDIAEATNDFLNEDLLSAVAPSSEAGKGKDVLMRDVLDEAAKRIEEASRVGGRFEEMPLVEASIRATLGSTYDLLGEYAAAEPHLERAHLLSRRELGEEHPSTLASVNDLANLYVNQGRHDEAKPLFVKTLEIQKRVLGEDHPSTLASMNNFAILYYAQGRYDEAEPLYVKTLEIRKRVLGEEHPETLSSMNNLAALYAGQGRYEEAEALHVKTLQIRKRVLGEEHPKTLSSIENLATLYHQQGRYEEAEPLFVKTLEIRKRVLGEEHPSTLGSMNNLAALYYVQGRYEEAEPLFASTLEIQKRVLGEEHPSTLSSMNNLAILYWIQEREDEAEPLYVKALEIMKRDLGEEHPATLASMNNLALLYKDQGRYDEAEPLYVKSLEIMKRVLGEEHPNTLLSMGGNLAALYQKQGRFDEAEPLLLKALEIQKRVLGDEHPHTLGSMNILANLYKEQGRYGEAEPLYVKTLEIQKRVLGKEHPSRLQTLSELAKLYRDQGRTDDVRPLVRALQEAKQRRADRPGASPSDKNALAWDLLTCEPADLRDPETALRLAGDACAMTDNANPGYLDTLALAQHLTGDTPAAIETEKKALSLLPPDAPGRSDYEAALAKFEASLEEADPAAEPGGG